MAIKKPISNKDSDKTKTAKRKTKGSNKDYVVKKNSNSTDDIGDSTNDVESESLIAKSSSALTKKKSATPSKKSTYGLGQTFGRPREVDYEKEAELLLDWVYNTPAQDCTHFVYYARHRRIVLDCLYQWPSQNAYFSQAYEIAKSMIYANQMQMTEKNKANAMVWNRYAFMYDPHLHAGEQAKKKFEADLAKTVDDNKVVSQLEKFNDHMDAKYKSRDKVE